jgi:hypothetical protein
MRILGSALHVIIRALVLTASMLCSGGLEAVAGGRVGGANLRIVVLQRAQHRCHRRQARGPGHTHCLHDHQAASSHQSWVQRQMCQDQNWCSLHAQAEYSTLDTLNVTVPSVVQSPVHTVSGALDMRLTTCCGDRCLAACLPTHQMVCASEV